MNGWCRVKRAAGYADVSVRTVREWLKIGLKYSRIGERVVVIRYADIDEFLESQVVTESRAKLIDRLVDETLRDFNIK